MGSPPTSDDGRFLNLDGSGPHPLRNVLKWAVVDTVLGRRRRTPGTAPAPRTWIGHASWLVQVDGVSLLIDPVMGERVWTVRRNVPAALGPGDLPPIDAVLVTHNHYDHPDVPSIRAVGA